MKIIRVDDDPVLADIVYRIQTVIRLLFSTTTIYKIFATEDQKIFKQATQMGPSSPQQMMLPSSDVIELKVKCQKCGKDHCLYVKFSPDAKIDEDFKKKGCLPFPADSNKLICDCGFEHDLSGMRNQIETQLGRKIKG